MATWLRCILFWIDISQVDNWNQQRNEAFEVHKLVVAEQETTLSSSSLSTDDYNYNDNGQVFDKTIVGGTFDHIHAGHKILLTMTALLASKTIYVGVTGKYIYIYISIHRGAVDDCNH